MDKSVLIEYADMKEEIKDLRRRIDADKKELDRLNSMVVTDSVTCGKKGKKPLRTVKIQGKPTMKIIRKNELLKKRIAKLEYLELELLDLTNQEMCIRDSGYCAETESKMRVRSFGQAGTDGHEHAPGVRGMVRAGGSAGDCNTGKYLSLIHI